MLGQKFILLIFTEIYCKPPRNGNEVSSFSLAVTVSFFLGILLYLIKLGNSILVQVILHTQIDFSLQFFHVFYSTFYRAKVKLYAFIYVIYCPELFLSDVKAPVI